MNSKRYPTQNYVPINPENNFYGRERSLDSTLKKMTFDKIVADPYYHFQNCYVTNFDLINNECRGDPLSNSREHYETIYKKKLYDEIKSEDLRYHFLSAAIRSERNDVNFEKSIFKEHFDRDALEKKLEKKGIFLSLMKRKAYLKKKQNEECKSLTDDCKSLTDDCKSLKF